MASQIDRTQKILEIARNNAMVGLDQGDVDAYEDNMRDTIAAEFPDWTQAECVAAETEFNRIARPVPTALKTRGTFYIV